MTLAHSRGTSCAAPRCVPRITMVVIRPAANTVCLSADTAMSQVRTSCHVFMTIQAGKFEMYYSR